MGVRFVFVVLALGVLSACNTMDVRPAQAKRPLGMVCIKFNEAVAVRDFVDVLQAGFARHGFQSQLVYGAAGPECDGTLTYTAERSWDIVPYLSLAELHLWQGGVEIGRVYYRHRNGFSLIKWAGTESKMDPLIDELLAGVSPGAQVAAAAQEGLPTPVPPGAAQPAVQSPPDTGECESCKSLGRQF